MGIKLKDQFKGIPDEFMTNAAAIGAKVGKNKLEQTRLKDVKNLKVHRAQLI